MNILFGPDGTPLKVPDLTDPEKRVPYSTDWFMVFVRRKSTREELHPITLQAPSVDAAYRAVQRRIEHNSDLEIYHIKQRKPRAWARWEVGLTQRWI